MRAEFRTELSQFMNWIFGADNINSHNSKRINGRNITASEIPFYFKSYFESLTKQKDTKDTKNTKLKMEEYENANNIANNMRAVETAFQVYVHEMNAEFNILTTWREETIRKTHNKCSEEAMKLFHSISKFGDESSVKEYEKSLQNLLDTALKQALKQKDFKNAAIAIAAISGGILAGVTIATLSGPAALVQGLAILIARALNHHN
jgi:YesN/AraC family two-component response regulator